ncbi:unnamed protein product, partial [Meganyctiphanes norvegica]
MYLYCVFGALILYLGSIKMDSPKLWTVLVAVVRFVSIILNMLYCIPVYVLWLFMLQPLKWMSEQIFWTVEGYLFRMELAMVTWWSHSAGYHIQEIGEDVFELIDEPCLVMINHQSMSDVPLL